jgi:hypothetical protein
MKCRTWVIYNRNETDPASDRLNARGMYWNNRAGWVPRQQASRFSAAAKRAQSALPGVGSTWVCATRRA